MKSTFFKKIQITAATAIIFFAVTMIFRQYFNVMAVLGIRPSALPPALGLMLGPFGVLGCALGNLIADIVSGYSLLMIALGFVGQFTYGILPYLMWKSMNELVGDPSRPIRLNNVKSVVQYIVIVLVNAVIMAAFLGSIMQSIGVSPFVSTSTLMLFLNNFVFCIVLGIPIIIFMSARKLTKNQVTLSINERLILVFLIAGVVSGGLIGIFSAIELSYAISDPVTMWMRIYMYIAVNLLAFYMITIVFLWYCERKITIPVESIAQIAKNFVNGGHEKKDSVAIVKECDVLIGIKGEAGILAEAFKTMVLDLDIYIQNLTKITTENERIATELNVAKQMQADMLPNVFPAFPEREEFEIYAIMQPAKEIGGDFYDFFMIDSDHLGIVIADVSGKGIPAALFMVITRTLINNWARNGIEPMDVFTKVNSQLCEGNENAMFVTAWMGILKLSTLELIYSNAGHDPPLIKEADDTFHPLTTRKNLMLAGMDGVKYKQSFIKMQQGDKLFLYTDGVTEANDCQGNLYGKIRLETILNRTANLKPRDSLTHIKADIDKFADGEPQFDDITMLMLSII
ncbi:MAG: PP2C family protein-serine/threonine phosphatase [Defluviitaleaceae bacterium]|nr:PP2C family protein-serine/threonine phosphatase [Defluviitaleaceae bacterium]